MKPKIYLILFLLLNIWGQAFTQTRIFSDDFGAPGPGVQQRQIWPYMPVGINTFVFAHPDAKNLKDVGNENGWPEAKHIDNNFYAVVCPRNIYTSVTGITEHSFKIWKSILEKGDITEGHEGNGGAMIINAGTTLAAFYARIVDLQAGKYYRLRYQLFVENSSVKINHRVLSSSGGTSVALYEGTAQYADGNWKQQDYWFFMPENCSSGNYTISIENAHKDDQGNDYAIDDLLFEVYEPEDVEQSIKDALPPSAKVNCGINEPVAFDDEVAMECNHTGELHIGFLFNDKDENGAPVSAEDFIVRLDVPVGAKHVVRDDSWRDAKEEEVIVAGEGTWFLKSGVKTYYHTLTFKPEVGFTGNPSPISYRLYNRKTGGGSNRAFIKVFSDCNPRAVDDIKEVTEIKPGTPIPIDIFANDEPANQPAPVDPAKIKKVTLINPHTLIPVENGPMMVDGEGEWKYENGKLTFTPINGFSKEPTPINYTFTDTDSHTSNPAKVTIKVVPSSMQKNYWHGTVSNEWTNIDNWTAEFVPATGEDIEFATDDNNGSSGNGNGLGTAIRDLHLDTDREIGNLINNSNVDLLVTTGNQLTINGVVKDDNPNEGTIVVKTSTNEPTGTLLFSNPSDNRHVNATVEFYNKAYECATCGFYKKQWQYFGIPVASAEFPYIPNEHSLLETIHKWDEPTNGNKWITPTGDLEAFVGYEINNKSTTQPEHIYEFKGKLNVGDAEVYLTKTSGVNYEGMNLIANSFTAAIPISADAIKYDHWKKTVYLFNTGTRDQWRKLNGGVSSGIAAGQYQAVPFDLAGQAEIPDRILSMHTFMLDVETPGNITLKYDQLLKNELNASTVKPWKSAELRSSTIQLPHIVMDVISNGSADRVWLFEKADATTEFDNGWDGYKMKEGDLIQTYVLGSDQSDYQIATVPEIIGTTIGVSSGLNENYSINFSVTPDVESRNLFLRDLFTGRNYSIKNNAEYVINGTNNSNNNRFKIVASSSSLIDEDIMSSPINIYVMNNIIIVDNQSEEDCSVMVYDLMGRLVANKQAPKSQITEFTNINQNKTGVYIVKVLGESNSINKTDRVLLR
ncbi:T9SS type A sorting domain-containing protein [Dysgonomonas sp. Marseille-P4361]|uniref:T9SS type A sorting domain-containing protein n=1 Tax=Dysgonomonas sp. Marseille-P4361 TaxID=2161820 RepID=UPI000D5565FE|nr:T9SS type A sorting domain-containing protein [Dysgonomonas sp. Marseille-P4361]